MAKSRAERWRDFEEAREFARSLGLGGSKEWRVWAKSGKRPRDIPANPGEVQAYKDAWQGYGDWLGTGNTRGYSGYSGPWRPFEEAREYVRSLGLRNFTEWREYSKSGEKPVDIPFNPKRIYSGAWVSWGDWLGTGRISTRYMEGCAPSKRPGSMCTLWV